MFGIDKLKNDIEKLKNYSMMTHTELESHIKLTLEFVDVIKEKLNAFNERLTALEVKRKRKKKRGPYKKRIKEESNAEKVYGFQVKTKRKRRKKNVD